MIVAIRLDETAAGGARPYQELHEDFADPDAQPAENPGPTGDDPDADYPWSFWLTDTTCNNSSRQRSPATTPPTTPSAPARAASRPAPPPGRPT